MRVVLVNVQYHEGNNVFPPLGTLYVGAALRAAGHTVRILDGDPRHRPTLLTDVVDFAPEVVGFSFMTMTWRRAAELIAEVAARLPDTVRIGGGPHCTAEPEATLRALDLHAVVVGEGEDTAVALLEALVQGRPLHRVPGVVTPEGAGPARAYIRDLDRLAFPARDLLGHEPYLRPPGLIRGWVSSRIASMLAGRGCPYGCAFCESHQQMGTAVRMRSVGNVLAELDHLVEVDRIRGMYWVDDVFTHHREWVLEFCAALQQRPYRLSWGCQSRVTAVDEALLVAMRDAGCVQVDFGVESGSVRMLKEMRKGVQPRDAEDAFGLAHSVGLRTGASFILGAPGETAEDLAATAELARRLRSDWTIFFFSTPYPGTALWERASPQERATWPDWGDAWNNRVGPDPIVQGSLDGPTLVRTRARLQNRHFARNYLRLRNMTFIAQLALMLPDRRVRQAIGRTFQTGRLDEVVEASFAAWRAP